MVIQPIAFPQKVLFRLIDFEHFNFWMIWAAVFQNLENLENIEPGLNGLFVPWNKMALATEFIFNAVLLFIFYLLSIVVAENVQFIDLFLFGGSSYFVKVNVDHFVSKVFNIDFGKNNFVNFFCPLWVFYVDNSKQGVGAAIQNF